MADVFWDVATSCPVLGVVGLIFLAALVVGYFPLLKWFPIIGDYVPVGKQVSLIAMGLLCLLIGFRLSDERSDAKNLKLQLAATAIDLTASQNATKQADDARAELANQARDDQERIAKYEAELKLRPNDACTLTPDDFSDGVRAPIRAD